MQEIRDSLVSLTIEGMNKGIITEGVPLNKHLEYRDSLIHKLGFLEISKNYLLGSLNELRQKLATIDPSDAQKVYDSCFQATTLVTYHLECFIYHLLSSLDNLKSIIPFFYKDLSHATSSMRQMYDSVLDQPVKLSNKQIFAFMSDQKYSWLITKNGDGLYDYRAKIYHWISSLCGSTATLAFPTDNFSYKLKVHLPEKLSKIMNCPRDMEIDDFTNMVLQEYKIYISGLISAIRKDIE